jgi:hypothetical protein
MSTYVQEYLDKLYDLSIEAEVELTPTYYRLFLQKAIEEFEVRLSDFTDSSNYDDEEDN